MSNFGKAFVIFDSNGRPLGRAIPRREAEKGYAVTFRIADKTEVRVYGPAEFELKRTNNSWTLGESYLTVSRVSLDNGVVSVVLMHNSNSAWNQIISVPFAEDWQKAVTAELVRLNKLYGSETHIDNYRDLVV